LHDYIQDDTQKKENALTMEDESSGNGTMTGT